MKGGYCRHFEDNEYILHNRARRGEMTGSTKLFLLREFIKVRGDSVRVVTLVIFIPSVFLEDILQCGHNATHLFEVMFPCERSYQQGGGQGANKARSNRTGIFSPLTPSFRED